MVSTTVIMTKMMRAACRPAFSRLAIAKLLDPAIQIYPASVDDEGVHSFAQTFRQQDAAEKRQFQSRYEVCRCQENSQFWAISGGPPLFLVGRIFRINRRWAAGPTNEVGRK